MRAPLGSAAWENRESSRRTGDSGAHGSGWYGCWYVGVFGASKETRLKREAEEDREHVRARFLGGDETLQGDAGGLGCGVEVQEEGGGGGQGDAGLVETDRRQDLSREDGQEMGFC